MLDKELIKNKFQKSIATYSKNAVVQQKIAQKLSGYINGNFDNILEIGSYSGLLTKEIIKNTSFKSYLAVDIVNSFDYIKDLSPKIKFKLCDIEEEDLHEKFDLIISSSSLQWCSDFNSVIKKLKSYLMPNGQLIIAIFGEKNLYQIKEVFGVSLNYPNIANIKKMFSSSALIFEEVHTISFSTSYELLKHLKYTGVNSFRNNFTYSQIKEKMKILENNFQNKLTYNPLYIID